MSGSSAAPTPPLSLAEMQVLVARAGLTLNPGQMADLVLAWRQMVGLLGLIGLDRPMVDDQAFVFRVPAPATAAEPSGAVRKRAAVPRAGMKASVQKAIGKKAPGKKAPGKRAAGKKAAGKKAAARKPVRRR